MIILYTKPRKTHDKACGQRRMITNEHFRPLLGEHGCGRREVEHGHTRREAMGRVSGILGSRYTDERGGCGRG